MGADLAAIINEAAIRAARRGAALIGKTDVKNALSEYYESRSALNSAVRGRSPLAAPKEQPITASGLSPPAHIFRAVCLRRRGFHVRPCGAVHASSWFLIYEQGT